MEKPKSDKQSATYMRGWRAKNAEHSKEYMRQWRAEHREQVKASRRAYYFANKEKANAESTRWSKENPEGPRASRANARYDGKLSHREVRAVFARDNFTCYWCGKEDLKGDDLTIEHLEPHNDAECITTACRSCNSKKLHRGGRKQCQTKTAT